tara:strand:+ start:215 stop:442 length:228 start_codon:yes stop_codon:yes gene_type:complete
MVAFHRFSPRSNGGIKRTKRVVNVITKNCKIRERSLIKQLMELGYSYEIATGCIPYLEYYEINAALTVIYELLEK